MGGIEKGELCEWETRRGSEEEHGHAIDALTSTAPSHRTASDVYSGLRALRKRRIKKPYQEISAKI